MAMNKKRYNDGMSAELRYYHRNRDVILAKRKNDPRNKDRVKRYRAENLEKVRVAERARRIATKAQRDAWFKKNKEAISERKKIKYAENREVILSERRKRYSENAGLRERASQQSRAWAQANPEKVRASHRAYAVANPERLRLLSSAKRARKRNAKGRVSPGITARLMSLQKGRCAVCRCDLSAAKHHIDHILPLALGGEHDDKNMQLLCKPCNLSKHAKHPVDFMRSRGFLL